MGVVLAWGIPGAWPERLGMGLPLWFGGGISLWVPLRQLTMFVKVDATGLESRGYFRTVQIRWEDAFLIVMCLMVALAETLSAQALEGI